MASTASGSSSKARSFAVDIPHRGERHAYHSMANRPRRSPRHRSLLESGASSLSSENSSPSLSSRPPMHERTPAGPDGRRVGDTPQHDGSPTLPHPPPSFSKLDGTCQTPHTKQKDKATLALEPPSAIPPGLIPTQDSPLGPAMLSSQTYTSINLNKSDPDEPPRLITFTKAGQGFNWNEELFLPSYLINRYSRSRRKQFDGDFGDDDVDIAEIFVTDEEADHLIP